MPLLHSWRRADLCSQIENLYIQICPDSLFGCLQGGFWELSGWDGLIKT